MGGVILVRRTNVKCGVSGVSGNSERENTIRTGILGSYLNSI